MRTTVVLRPILIATLLSVPALAVAQYGAPTTPAPGPSFVWVGQWVPCSHPLAIQAGKGCVQTTPVSQVLTTSGDVDEPPPPPVQDEWEYTEAYTGVATKVPVLVRTANESRWFCKGCN